jgi:hypothetical protein
VRVRYDTEARRDVFFSEDALNEWRKEVRVVFNHRSHDTVEIAAGPDRGYASDRTMWEAAMSKETPKPPGRTPINAHSTHVDDGIVNPKITRQVRGVKSPPGREVGNTASE